MFVSTVNMVLSGSVVHNRIKTITISDSNQAQVQHSRCSTDLHNIKTNTVLKPTQESILFKLQRCTGLLTCFKLHTSPPPAGRHSHGKAIRNLSLSYAAHLTRSCHKVVGRFFHSLCFMRFTKPRGGGGGCPYITVNIYSCGAEGGVSP